MDAAAVSRALRESAAILDAVSRTPYADHVVRCVDLLEEAFRGGHVLLVFGNGGSAADAEHLCAELVGRFRAERRPLPAVALTANSALVTAWSNDQAFEDVFARQVEALGRPGDVAWGISTSGDSPNVVNGLQRARARGLRTIGLTGEGGGRCADYCDVLMAVPVRETPRVQEVHLVTYHAVCGALEARLLGPSSAA